MKTPYIPHGWQALEMITQAALNHMEGGISGNDEAIRALESWRASGGGLPPAPAILKDLDFAPAHLFADAMASTGVQAAAKIEPVQERNAQDSPWPGGSGKNLFNPALFPDRTASGITSEIQPDGTIHLFGTATATTRYSTSDSVGNNILLPAGTYKVTGSPYAVWARNDKTVISENGVFTVDGTAPIRLSVALTNGAEVDVYEKIQIEAGETATDWEPYENVWPIAAGVTAVEITGAGENLCPMLNVIPSGQSVTVTVNEDGSVTVNGTQGETDGIVALSTPFTVKAGRTYYLSGCPSGGSAESYRLGFCLPNQGADPDITVYDTGSGKRFTPTKTHQTCVCVYLAASAAVDCTFTPMVQPYSTVIRDYAPYQGIIHNILLPASAGAVYGGQLTVHMDGSAVLLVDRIALNLGELNYTKGSNGYYYFTTLETPLVRESSVSAIPDLLCDILPVVSASDVSTPRVDYGISLSTANNRLHIRFASAEDATQLQAFLTGHIAVARLASPEAYEFTAEQIMSFAGENIIYANTGDVAVEYVSDTNAIIESLSEQSGIFSHGVNHGGLDVSYKDGVLRINGTLTTPVNYKITDGGVMWEHLLISQMTGLLTLKAGHKYILHCGDMDNRVTIALLTYDNMSGEGKTEYAELTSAKHLAEGAVLAADKLAKLMVYPEYVYAPGQSAEEANTYDHLEIPFFIEEIDCTQ